MNLRGEQLVIDWQSQLIRIHDLKNDEEKKEIIRQILKGIAENYNDLRVDKWQDSAHLTFLVYNLQNIRARYGITFLNGEMEELVSKVLTNIALREKERTRIVQPVAL